MQSLFRRFAEYIHSLPLLRSLGVEPVDKDVLKQKPRNTKEPMITRHLIINVLLSATIIILGTLWVYNREVTASSETVCMQYTKPLG